MPTPELKKIYLGDFGEVGEEYLSGDLPLLLSQFDSVNL